MRDVFKGLVALALAVGGASGFAGTSAVADALQRPALQVRSPERVVLLAAAAAGERTVAVGERGVIVVGDAAAAAWRQVPSPVSVTLTAVKFADANHGVAVGHGGTVLVTRDGGDSWQLRLDGKRLADLAVQQARGAQALAEAQRLVADGPDKPLLDVVLWDAQRLLVVGAYGVAFYSADAGASWQSWMERLPNPKALHWYVARAAGPQVWLAGEQGLLARSHDGGRTFAAVVSPYRGSWFTGALGEDGTVTLAGMRANLWRSTDGGRRWDALAVPVPGSLVTSTPATDGSLLLANQAGVVLRLQGQTVEPLNHKAVPTPAGVLQLADGTVLTVGFAGVVKLPAGGRP